MARLEVQPRNTAYACKNLADGLARLFSDPDHPPTDEFRNALRKMAEAGITYPFRFARCTPMALAARVREHLDPGSYVAVKIDGVRW